MKKDDKNQRKSLINRNKGGMRVEFNKNITHKNHMNLARLSVQNSANFRPKQAKKGQKRALFRNKGGRRVIFTIF